MIATPTGKPIRANELLNDADAHPHDKGMSRREINALLHETYANNAMRDFPKIGKHPILERITGLADRFLSAITPKTQNAENLGEVTREALPMLKAAHNWSREL